jgi:hypothetical protein
MTILSIQKHIGLTAIHIPIIEYTSKTIQQLLYD